MRIMSCIEQDMWSKMRQEQETVQIYIYIYTNMMSTIYATNMWVYEYVSASLYMCMSVCMWVKSIFVRPDLRMAAGV